MQTITRLSFLGSLLAAPLLLGPASAHAGAYEDCERNRQEACYGEGDNMINQCFQDSGSDRELCLRNQVLMCETWWVQSCDDLDSTSTSGSSSSSRLYEVNCPAGTAPDLLGRCVAVLKARPGSRDKDPDDWCEGGTIVGPTGECIPDLSVVRFTATGDGWYMACPPGMMRGAVEGRCEIDMASGGGSQAEGCPRGQTKGPHDDCVPHFVLAHVGNAIGSMLLDVLTKGDLFERFDASEFTHLLNAAQVTPVENPEVALQQLAEDLEADIEQPDSAY